VSCELIQRCFSKKKGEQRYQYLFIGRKKSYFVKSHSKLNNKYKQDEIQMLDFLINNIFILFGGRVFQQTIGIPVGTNCAPLLADLFLHVYEADFLQGLLKYKDRELAQTFNSSFRYIDNVLSLNNARFGDYLHRIYPNELEVKDTTDTQKSASCVYLDLHFEIDKKIRIKLYDKRDDLTFPIVNFPFISSNIPASPTYRVYISELTRYSRTFAQYHDFLDRAQLLTQKLLKQSYVAPRLKS
jgi:hypothetical protein